MRGHTKTLILTLSFVMSCFLGINSVSALTYQDNLDVSFIFDSSISVSLSSDNLTISSLSPDTYADSNIVTVTTSTNNPSGYALTATTGNSETYTSTNLINDANIFVSLGTSDSISTMSSADATQNGRWGYAFSINSGSTWKNATGGTGYSGLPYYTAPGAEIISSNTSGASSVQFKIGAKANAAQSAGTYKNVINFVATANPDPSIRHYTVNYYDNYVTADDPLPSPRTGILQNNRFTISDQDIHFEGGDIILEQYGWCTESVDYDTTDTCSSKGGSFYAPGETITVSGGAGDVTINLYRVWAVEKADGYLTVKNESDASVHLDGTFAPAGSYGAEVYYTYNTTYEPLVMRIDAPSTCPSNWVWSADVDDMDDGGEPGVIHSGSGGDSLVLASPWPDFVQSLYVTITGHCNN